MGFAPTLPMPRRISTRTQASIGLVHNRASTPDGEIAITPNWSADGLWIAYRVGTLLKKVRVGNRLRRL